jgi:hypothetical protein
MKPEQFFPVILIVLDICAAGGYLVRGGWRLAIYWAAAAVLSYTVTFNGWGNVK